MAKVMLVEDDNNLREIYEARLQAEGYTIVSARDGEEALVIAKSEKPDLIISDVMMPKISGFEMLDILRNTEGLKDVKVIMLTALGQSDDQQRADRLGADRYLVKSQVTLEDIVKVAQHLLSSDDNAPAPVAAAADAAVPAAAAAPVASAIPEPVATPVITVSAPPLDEPAQPVADTPAPAADPVTAPAVDPASITLPDVQSEQQENSAVEAQIESFVAGASSEASPAAAAADQPPAPEAVATPETTVPVPDPVTPPTEAETAAAATVSDDNLMAAAADALVADTQPVAAEPVASEPAEPPVISPAGSAPEPVAAPEATPEESEPASGQQPIAHKKVIEPLGDTEEPKSDINTLLAREEALEAAQTPGGVIQASAVATPPTETPVAAPATPQDPNQTIDPNSIAL